MYECAQDYVHKFKQICMQACWLLRGLETFIAMKINCKIIDEHNLGAETRKAWNLKVNFYAYSEDS